MTAPHKSPYRVTTPFKRKGRLWSLGYHTGDDWNTPTGTKTYAMADGVVRATGFNQSYGNHAIVETVIAGVRHRWSVNHQTRVTVKTGQKVKAGQVIGYTGSTGHVTGPHDHVEDRVAPFTFAGPNFRDPAVLYAWRAKVVRAKWATLRPKKAPPIWFRALSINAGDYAGLSMPDARRHQQLAIDIRELAPDVIGFQELARANSDRMDDLLAPAGMFLVDGGSDGRRIALRRGTKVKHETVFDLKPRYRGDDKQATAVIATVRGHDALLVSAHLEHEDETGESQVGQAESLIKQAEQLAAAHGLSKVRIVYMLDSNSDNRVRIEAFNDAHYVDTMETAWRIKNAGYATTVPFGGKPRKGARIDLIACHRARPCRYAAVRIRRAGRAADHLIVLADIALITA